MLLIKKRAFARAGLMGNPSDGYNGKTVSITIRDYFAEVVLYEWEDVEVVPSQEDQSRFRSVRELATDVKLHGYYGGIRLVKATIKRFVEYCDANGVALHDHNFSIRYQSTIPRQVGLAGSSAIIVATLRCLMEFYGVDIPKEVQPSLALSVETVELGIPAGLQDRVIQVYENLVFMDFSKELMEERQGFRCGRYEPLDPSLLPTLYLAYSARVSEPTEVVHNDLRARFDRGDLNVVAAMREFARLAEQAKQAILARDAAALSQLINANFDLRHSICKIAKEQVEMVRIARQSGASAKFAGSGGAIIGCYPDEATYQRLETDLGAFGCKVLRLKF